MIDALEIVMVQQYTILLDPFGQITRKRPATLLLYSTLLYSTLRYATLLYSTLLYSTLQGILQNYAHAMQSSTQLLF